MKKNIVWLASYPKSGNTWVRLFLQNLLNKEEDFLDINDPLAKEFKHSANTPFFNYSTLLKHTVLSQKEITQLRPQTYAQLNEEEVYLKTHESFKSLADVSECSKSVIYIVRNPLDIAISFSHFFNKTIDNSISSINNSAFTLAQTKKSGTNQLPQLVSSWSQNVDSWVNQPEIPLYLVKYEDLLDFPFEQFTRIVNFLQLNKQSTEIQNAIELSSFKSLKAQEEKNGFKEQRATESHFFRKGEKNEWKNHLTPSQINHIVSENKTTMKRLGYLES